MPDLLVKKSADNLAPNHKAMALLVSEYLQRSAAKFPDKTAIIKGGKRMTYSEMLFLAQARATWLYSRNQARGFRAAILTDDPFEYIAAYFAIQLAGGIVVGLNTQPCERSLKTILTDCSASFVFLAPKFKKYLMKIAVAIPSLRAIVVEGNREKGQNNGEVEWLNAGKIFRNAESVASYNPPEVSPEDIAQIIYTSGTTGQPKGVMLRHRNLVANTEAIVEYLALSGNDRVMAVLPFFYSYGNSVLLTHFAVGGSLVVNQSFMYPNVILEEMVEHQVTGFSGVPSTYAILLNRSAVAKYDFPSLRYLTQAGAAMAPQLSTRLQKIFPGVKIFIMYGQTEAAARLSYLPPEDIEQKAGSIGKAIPGVILSLRNKNDEPVAVDETGEIVAEGENIMAGYWNRPRETAEALRGGKLWTGDLARADADGYLFMVSRKSDMIKSGSHRISPKEIEDVIHEYPVVHEVAVVGRADEILGEIIMACIVLKPGSKCLEKEIIRHCRKNLSAFKVPQQVVFMDELPKTATGKIKKTDL